MGRKRVDINPICGKRLKRLIQQEQTSQKELATNLHISAQSISKIVNGHASLTVDNAILIHRIYPAYRVEWLLGLDDDPTEADAILHSAARVAAENKVIQNAVTEIAELSGFCVERLLETQDVIDGHISPREAAFCIEISKEVESVRMSFEAFSAFGREVRDFIEFRLKRILAENNGRSIGRVTVADFQGKSDG